MAWQSNHMRQLEDLLRRVERQEEAHAELQRALPPIGGADDDCLSVAAAAVMDHSARTLGVPHERAARRRWPRCLWVMRTPPALRGSPGRDTQRDGDVEKRVQGLRRPGDARSVREGRGGDGQHLCNGISVGAQGRRQKPAAGDVSGKPGQVGKQWTVQTASVVRDRLRCEPDSIPGLSERCPRPSSIPMKIGAAWCVLSHKRESNSPSLGTHTG